MYIVGFFLDMGCCTHIRPQCSVNITSLYWKQKIHLTCLCCVCSIVVVWNRTHKYLQGMCVNAFSASVDMITGFFFFSLFIMNDTDGYWTCLACLMWTPLDHDSVCWYLLRSFVSVFMWEVGSFLVTFLSGLVLGQRWLHRMSEEVCLLFYFLEENVCSWY